MLHGLLNLPENEEVNVEASELSNHLSQGLDTPQLEHHSLEKRSHSHSESILFKMLQFVNLGIFGFLKTQVRNNRKKLLIGKLSPGQKREDLTNCIKHTFKKLRIILFSTEARIPQQVLKIKCINFILIDIC